MKQILLLCRDRLRNRSGMTMVSIIVAFVVLLLGVAMLLGVMQFAQSASVKAEQRRRDANELLEKYYVNDESMHKSVVGLPTETFTLTDGETSFALDMTQYSYTYEGKSLYAFGKHTLP